MEKFRRLLLPRLAQVGLRKAIAQSTVQHCCSDKLPTGRTLRFILASSLSLSIYFSSCNNRVSDSAAERSAGISTQTDVADTSLGIDVLAQKDDTASLKLHKEILVRAAKSANFMKFKFIHVRHSSNHKIKLYAAALGPNDSLLFDTLLTENGNPLNQPQSFLILPGWVLTRTALDSLFPITQGPPESRFPASGYKLKPTKRSPSPEGFHKLFINDYLTYELVIDGTGSNYYLNPSPPG